MPPKEPTKHQLSHRLQFQSHTPNFLKAFQARVSGRPLHDDEEDEDDPRVVSDEEGGGVGGGSGGGGVKLDEFGREIRMGSEEREMRAKKQGRRGGATGPEGRSGGAGAGAGDGEEEGDDEAPTIVVLKEGKHLSAREVENERRRAKGLPPLAEDSKDEGGEGETTTMKASTTTGTTTTTGSGTTMTMKKSGVQLGGRTSGTNKRKIISIREDDEDENEDEDRGGSQ
ncbi:hypothetical protein FRC15_011582, partial [Serendipita sp. 397]